MKIESPSSSPTNPRSPSSSSRTIYYHLNCFKCLVCDKVLQKGDEFVLRNEGIYCKNDFNFISQQPPNSAAHLARGVGVIKQNSKPCTKSNTPNTLFNSNNNSSFGNVDYTNSSLLFSSSPSSSASSVSSVSSISSLSSGSYSSTNLMSMGGGGCNNLNNSLESSSNFLLNSSSAAMGLHSGVGQQYVATVSGQTSIMHKLNSINTNSNSSFTSMQSKLNIELYFWI